MLFTKKWPWTRGRTIWCQNCITDANKSFEIETKRFHKQMQHAQWKVPHPWLGSIPSALAPGVSPCCGTLLWCPIVVAPSAPSRRFKDVVQRLCAETSFFNCWCLGLAPVSHKKHGKQAPLQSQTVHTPVEPSQVCYKIRKHTPSSTSTFDKKYAADAPTKSECMPLLNHHTSIKFPSIECTPPSPGPRPDPGRAEQSSLQNRGVPDNIDSTHSRIRRVITGFNQQ